MTNRVGIENGVWKEMARPKRNHYGGGLAVMHGKLVLFGKYKKIIAL